MNKNFKKIKNLGHFSRAAQSIIELSILGAALLGIFGLLIRYSSTLSDMQGTQLKAMREALKMSATEGMSLKPTPDSTPHAPTPANKTANRKGATVLWIEDRPTIEGGDKYGAVSLTPTVSFGSGTMTNLLQYPMRPGDPNSIPLMDIFVNGKHFTFSTVGYGWAGYFATQNGQSPGVGDPYQTLTPVTWDTSRCNNPNYSAPCLQMIPKPRENTAPWGFGPPGIPVLWTKIPRTDKRFCYGQGDPSTHYCDHVFEDWQFEERWRLDKVNKTNGQFKQPVPVDLRSKMQWQWFPVIPNSFSLGFWGEDSLLMLDVDYDGHEETVVQFAQSEVFECGLPYQRCTISARHFWGDGKPSSDYDYQPNSDCCHNAMGGWETDFKAWEFFTIDAQNGDLNMGYDTVDKLQGKPSPGFVSGKAKIKTYAVGDLDMTQTAQGTQSLYTSKQTKDIINVIEREIQLSNDTGRFVAGSSLPSCGDPSVLNPQCTVNCSCFDNPDVDVACYDGGSNCCESPQNKYRTCFNRSNLILYVRSLTTNKIGSKSKTTTPMTTFP